MRSLLVSRWTAASFTASWVLLWIGLLDSVHSLTIPVSLDWTSKGAVTPVNRYANSQYSAAVVIVETIESLHAIATGQRTRGSIARVIDCCNSTGFTYNCVHQLGGICAYDDYPDQRGRCESDACVPFTTFDTLDDLSGKNESSLLVSIQAATLMINIDASPGPFITYSGGIYQERNCSQTDVTHALQLIGYGNAPTGEQYWIAKNSWGPDWGEKGFVRILRDENICGLTRRVYQPWTNGNLPTVQTVSVNTTTPAQTTEVASSTSGTAATRSTLFLTVNTTASGMIKISSSVFFILSLRFFFSVLI